MTRKMRALLLLFLALFLTSCGSVYGHCPKREPFTGTTWGDLAIYNKQLQVIYDACAQ